MLIELGIITEYRNLVALEQTHDDYKDKVTNLMVFMDNLIDTADDVDLLRDSKIIESRLGCEEVANFFNHVSSGLIYLFIFIFFLQPSFMCYSFLFCKFFPLLITLKLLMIKKLSM